MSDEVKIRLVGESGPEPITVDEIARLTIARALHDAVCPSGSRCDDSPTTWDRRWFQTAEVAVAALVKADLLRGRILAAPAAPSEPVPDGPRVWAGVELPAGGETREEWRVSGDTNGPHAIDDGPWERIYTDRTYAAGHVDVLKRGHPEVTVGFHRRTVVTFTGEWSEVVEEATP